MAIILSTKPLGWFGELPFEAAVVMAVRIGLTEKMDGAGSQKGQPSKPATLHRISLPSD
jgi:hypothetical protein